MQFLTLTGKEQSLIKQIDESTMIDTIHLSPVPQTRTVVLDVILKKGKTFDEINKKLKEKGFSFKKEINDGIWHFFRFSRKQEFHFNHLDNAEYTIKSEIENFIDCSVQIKLFEK